MEGVITYEAQYLVYFQLRKHIIPFRVVALRKINHDRRKFADHSHHNICIGLYRHADTTLPRQYAF